MKKCYLIDDDKIFNLISSKMIERSGWNVNVSVFNNAETALELIQQNLNQPSDLPEIILLDIRMPEMDGFTFLERLSKVNVEFLQGLKVFMLSSSLDERDMQTAYQYKIVKGFLNKPLTIESLHGIIHDADLN
ncbi:MAG: response regulator [Bacteroidia bacterium]